MDQYQQTKRNKVKRQPTRGFYDKPTIFNILDAGYLGHVGFVVDGQPFVIPTLYGRCGDKLYIHGASTSRMIRVLEKGVPLCITVTHVDGLVLARSAFHHSVNYRSVVIFGHGRWVADEMKEKALEIISEHLIKGRWQAVRKPNAIELKATGVLEVTIDEASAKIRDKPPADEEEDYDLDIWAGIIPLHEHRGEPIPDERLKPGIEPDPSVWKFFTI